jgi:hypothetical protein
VFPNLGDIAPLGGDGDFHGGDEALGGDMGGDQ